MTMGTRMSNPLWHACYKLMGINAGFTDLEKASNENGLVLREIVRTYVRKRTSGEAKSTIANGNDLLSLFLRTPDVFDEDTIIDEIFDFLVAGT